MHAITALRILQGFPSKLSQTAFSILISDSVALQEKSNYTLPACPHLKINRTCTRCLVFFLSLLSSSSPAGKCAVSNNTTAMLWRDVISGPPEAIAVKGHSENRSTWPTPVDLISALGLKHAFLELKRGKIPKANSNGVPYLPDRVLATFHVYYHFDPHHHPARCILQITYYIGEEKRLWEIKSLAWGCKSSLLARNLIHVWLQGQFVHLLCYSNIDT